jgi:hypothetical protein
MYSSYMTLCVRTGIMTRLLFLEEERDDDTALSNVTIDLETERISCCRGTKVAKVKRS